MGLFEIFLVLLAVTLVALAVLGLVAVGGVLGFLVNEETRGKRRGNQRR